MATKTFTQFRVDNVVTTEPTTLQYGKEVYYKDPNGVMTLYVGDENGNAQRALPLATPARKIYVFGGADNSFPYFSSFANALTYANSLTPSTTNPVSIVLLSQNDGTPFVITGADDWYALCLDGIYVSSPYREIFSTTTLPTTLPKGMRVMYRSGGVETLYVGNDSNVAQAVGASMTASEIRDELETLTGTDRLPLTAIDKGYREYYATVTVDESNLPSTIVATVHINDLDDSDGWYVNSDGVYQFFDDSLENVDKYSVFVDNCIDFSSAGEPFIPRIDKQVGSFVFTSYGLSTDGPIKDGLIRTGIHIIVFP